MQLMDSFQSLELFKESLAVCRKPSCLWAGEGWKVYLQDIHTDKASWHISQMNVKGLYTIYTINLTRRIYLKAQHIPNVYTNEWYVVALILQCTYTLIGNSNHTLIYDAQNPACIRTRLIAVFNEHGDNNSVIIIIKRWWECYCGWRTCLFSK